MSQGPERFQSMCAAETPNLLVAIRKNASSEEENLATEAFADLLRRFCRYDGAAALEVLNDLTHGEVGFTEADITSGMSTSTQVVATPQDTLDLVIESPALVVVVEVKVEAKLGEEQLERYRKWLDSQRRPRQCLVFLTRDVLDQEARDRVKCSLATHRRWQDVARCLEGLKQNDALSGVSLYLTGQFLEFLAERRITLEKVGWELGSGLHSLLNLMKMVDEAVPSGQGIKNKSVQSGAKWSGYGFKVDSTQCWTGVRYTDGDALIFQAQGLDKERATKAGEGKVEKQGKDGMNWENRLDLASEPVHFFARSGIDQRDQVVGFIERCIEIVRNQIAPASAPLAK